MSRRRAELHPETGTSTLPPPVAVPEGRPDGRFLLLAVAVAILLRFPGLLWPLTPDEAGFLLVARAWEPEPNAMFGHYWVDRPPTVIPLFKAADMLGGPYMPRVFAAALAALLVVAAHRAGRLIGGASAARWATIATVALVSNPELYAWAAKGEMLGIPLVMASCWLALESLHRSRSWRRLALAAGAGMTATLAMGMKQNLVGGLVFGAVLLVASVVSRRLPRQEGAALAGAAVAGAALPVLAVVSWTVGNGVHLSTLWEMIYGFRADAFAVITQTDMQDALDRGATLAWLFTATGLAAIFCWFLYSFRKASLKKQAVTWAVGALLIVDILGVVLGGSYWTPYLLPLIPGAALCVALLVGAEDQRGQWMRRIVVLTSILTAVWVASFTIERITGATAPTAYHIGMAVSEAARPTDTILPLYGRADIVYASALKAPYRYLWSLPARVRDPELAHMRALLASPEGPTWVVEWNPINMWNIDRHGRLRAVLERHYVDVGQLCDHTIWRRIDAPRPPLPAIDCSQSWLEIQYG